MINIKNMSLWLLVAAASTLVACDRDEVIPTKISLSVDNTEVKVGEKVTFTVESNSNYISLFTGDEGSNYLLSASYILAGKSEEDLKNNVYKPVNEGIRLYSVDFSETTDDQAAAINAGGGVVENGFGLDYVYSGTSIINAPTDNGSTASLFPEQIEGYTGYCMKLDIKKADQWSTNIRFYLDTELGLPKELVATMRFDSAEAYGGTTSFQAVPCIYATNKGDNDGEVKSGGKVWSIYWTPATDYTEYTINLTSAISSWEKANGPIGEIKYLDMMFVNEGYEGSAFIKSATFGENGYYDFDMGKSIPVLDGTGVSTFEYTYETPGVYTATAVVNNAGGKYYFDEGYKSDRSSTADEYEYSKSLQSIKIHVTE